jgi:5-formyltetrahydrofolate cyclo-ligase
MAKIPDTDKADLRRALLQRRRALHSAERSVAEARIATQILAWHQQQPGGVLGVFWPIQAEPDLLPLYEKLHASGAQLALPVVTDKQQGLTYFAWRAHDELAKDEYGIPIPAHRTQAVQPDAILVPCVGFNTQGFRIGYGGGFYDRTLAQAPRPYALGVAFSCAYCEFVPGEYDLALDRIVTELT